ncbi:hypothetical protein Tco_1220272 [Tanacetum coccineum]
MRVIRRVFTMKMEIPARVLHQTSLGRLRLCLGVVLRCGGWWRWGGQWWNEVVSREIKVEMVVTLTRVGAADGEGDDGASVVVGWRWWTGWSGSGVGDDAMRAVVEREAAADGGDDVGCGGWMAGIQVTAPKNKEREESHRNKHAFGDDEVMMLVLLPWMWWRWCGGGGCGVEMAAEVVMAADAMEMKVGMMEVVSAVAGSQISPSIQSHRDDHTQ